MGGVIRNKVAKVLSGAIVGYDGALIEVETDIKAGLPGVQIVGMGNKAIDEARQRVRSAVTNSLLDFPAQKITVNLAPAELPKDGTHLDLPIALSILVASGQLKQTEVDRGFFAGELALDGTIRPIRGAVVLSELAKAQGAQRFFLPLQNALQAQLVSGIEIIGVENLKQLYRALKGVISSNELGSILTEHQRRSQKASPAEVESANPVTIDMIIGHEYAKRALAIAAAGRHNLLFTGPPGTGKTLLAQSLAQLLPPLVEEEILEVTKLYSLAHGGGTIIRSPPLRSPHHSVTLPALIGGGLKPRPGDISLAHKGILFLDELPEYSRQALEALRQPLENRAVMLSRVYGMIAYPADALIVGTMNPCPCGYYDETQASKCTCTPTQIRSYAHKISGPLLDRFDLRLTISKIHTEHFFNTDMLTEKQHYKVVKQVLNARKAQEQRFKRSNFYNAYASFQDVAKYFNVTASAHTLLQSASKKMELSSRATLRTIRVARTIADLENAPDVDVRHVAEALQFRGTITDI